MNKLKLQQVSDTILLDNIMIILTGLNRDMVKEAGLVESFHDIAENIKRLVHQKVQEKGKFHALTEVLTAGTLLNLMGPMKGALTFGAQLFGIPIQGIIEKAVDAILPKLERGEKLTPRDLDVEASANYLNIKLAVLDDAHKNNQLFRLLRENQAGLHENIKLAAKSGGFGAMLARFFASKNKGSQSLFVKIILWFVKTALLGAGLMYVSPSISKEVKDSVHPLFGGDGEKKTDGLQNEERESVTLPPIKSHNFKASGKGEQFHQNNTSSMWIVPIINGDVKKTLLSWAKEIYPELKEKDNIILSSISFNKIASILDSLIEPGSPNSLVVPEGIHTRRNIVDVFIGDVAEKLKETNAS